ncbi:MAG TPA: energy transducer TonB [Pyrinomonadaceae bacterium]|nr:energy transducer TonB [Pyrinomonadaceae bacterium]
MSNTDSKFMQDEELRGLLNKWSAPEAPGSLDQRVAASYQTMSSERLSSVLDPQRENEVVKMKFCNTCQEQFADRFSFCPVDGTPLSVVPAVTAAPANNVAPADIETSYPMAETAEPEKPAIVPPAPIAAAPPVVTAAPSPVLNTVAAASTAAAGAHAMIGEYHLTILEDRGLFPRLAEELGNVAHNYQLTWPEFKRDPFGFMKRSFQGYGKMVGGFFASRDVVIAMLLSVVAMVALVGAIFLLDRTGAGGPSRKSMIIVAIIGFCGLLGIFATWFSRDHGAAVMGAPPSDSRNVLSGIIASFALLFLVVGGAFFWDRHQQAKAAELAKDDDLELTQMISEIPNEQPTPDEGTAGMAKGNGGGSKPKQEKAGGGGGGGREEQAPASFGKLPQADLRIPQVVAPDPHPPVIKNPALPMPATLDADPVLFPPDTRQLNYGDPKSKSTTPSSGPGTGNGIGSGTGGGVGPGSGGGYGPGEGGNTGGGSRNEGGGGPGGGGGGTDYNKIFSGRDVNSKARVLSKPEPTYTEAARKNQITGTVVLRAVFSSGGSVTNIHAVSGLPDGLTERAIAAAKQIRFVPATKDGRPVSMWMELQYNFNLY